MTAVVDEDKVHWQLKEYSVMEIQDLTVKTNSEFLNACLGPLHSVILSMVKTTLPFVKYYLEKYVTQLNEDLKHHKQFLTNVLHDHNYPIDLTMTQAPVVDGNSKIVQLNFNGVFFDSIHS